MTADLTVVSVSFNSERLLEWNWRLTDRLNPGHRVEWIVVDNGRQPFAALKDTVGVSVIPGVPRPAAKKGRRSYHHALALNKAVHRHVQTRFLLVLDPDFFITRGGWIDEVLSHMDAEQLGFLGATWDPGDYMKYRYFPSVHCFFVDLAKVPKETLDFRPDLDRVPLRRRFAQALPFSARLKAPLLVGTSRDTGYRIYERYVNDRRVRYECLQPVCAGADGSWLSRWLPDRWSLRPTRPTYSSPEGFLRDDIGPDCASLGWEEVRWRDRPFGIHLRSYGRRRHRHPEEMTILNTVLEFYSRP
jgi:hypothetical protein